MHQNNKRQTPRPDTAEKERRELFCYFYALLGNPREAAVQAGYPAATAAATAAGLLREKETQRRLALEQVEESRKALARQALAGLKRVALGDVTDPVRLAASDPESGLPAIETMDLFMVSELKRPKGGGWEIKFHDRTAALLALLKYAGQDSGGQARPNPGGSLYSALEKSALALGKGEKTNDL